MLALLAVILAVMSFGQDFLDNQQADPPPSITVQEPPRDPGEVERIVEDYLREHGGHVPDQPDGTKPAPPH